MRTVLVTMRVDMNEFGERRDCLDQNWVALLAAAGFTAVPVPNNPDTALALAAGISPAGFLLTGGNSLVAYGGDAPERDETERRLLDHSIQNNVPVAGVCRGMQFVQHYFGVTIERIDNHVARVHGVAMDGARHEVNSYHNWGTCATVPELIILATADDGVIEAVRHITLPIEAVMWHPERRDPFEKRDIEWLRKLFA